VGVPGAGPLGTVGPKGTRATRKAPGMAEGSSFAGYSCPALAGGKAVHSRASGYGVCGALASSRQGQAQEGGRLGEGRCLGETGPRSCASWQWWKGGSGGQGGGALGHGAVRAQLPATCSTPAPAQEDGDTSEEPGVCFLRTGLIRLVMHTECNGGVCSL